MMRPALASTHHSSGLPAVDARNRAAIGARKVVRVIEIDAIDSSVAVAIATIRASEA
jgi:hypothetical protein